MTTSASARDQRAAASAADRSRPAEAAWLAVLPCAGLVLAAILLLGPPLGEALFAPSGVDRFWPVMEARPEAVEHARFALALLAAPLGAAAVAATRWRPLRMRPEHVRPLVALAQVATASFLAFALLAQHNVLVRSYVPPITTPVDIFSVADIAAAALVTPVARAGGRYVMLQTSEPSP